MFAPKKRSFLLVAVIVLQLAVSLSLLCYSARVKHYAVKHGRIISLACRASDPFNPFKGRYVKLSLEESQLQGGSLDEESFNVLAEGRRSKKIYCRMVEAPDGLWKVAGLSRNLPPDGDAVYIEGTCSFWGSRGDGAESAYARIDYAFDEYYMQENYAEYADHIHWEDFNGLEPILSVYVSKSGTCIQQGLTVKDGKERIAFEEYCRRRLLEQEEGDGLY